jgi:predicted metal-dependent HD superfamily phosphohydrolase
MDFHALLTKWHITMSQEEIMERWSEPHRAYHGPAHLADLLAQINRHTELTTREREILTLAAIFHDIIYNPRRSDNEAQSADLFLNSVAMDKDNADIQEIATIIRDTKDHVPSTHLSTIFSHMDMDVVRRPYEELLKWEAGIRHEYKHVPGIAYVVVRARFLGQMIKKYPENAVALRRLRKRLLFPWGREAVV